jgi:hypothetical protein
MDAAYAIRELQWLEECEVAPAIFPQVMPRLAPFMAPLIASFCHQAPFQQAHTYIGGLLSAVERQNIASSAYRFGQDRQPLQRCIGWAVWHDAPLRQALTRQVAEPLGPADGVVVCDPAAFATSGAEAVGVARPWCGRLGTVDPCHVAISLGDVSAPAQSLGDLRLYLPQEWTHGKARRVKAGVPPARRGDRSRHPRAWDMVQDRGAALPPGWSAGDDELGRPYWWRRRRAQRAERYRLAVPGPTLLRDREVEPPASSGRGRRPQRPWQRVDPWSAVLSADVGTTMDVRDGAQGPLVVALVTRRVVARTPQRQAGHAEMVVGSRDRERESHKVVQVAFDLSKAQPEPPLAALAQGATAAHRLEEGLPRSKSEAGVADYEGRHGTGWPPHPTLS